ncbi:MAG: glycosyltransferase family 9 protein [Candidatus Kapabacteria bacterium]|nr:glycosyltransferase family 9 protein [Candidatus Kapabacteria bacterium]
MNSSPQHIAVVRTDRLGDMVLTLPMFPALRELFPQARLTLVAARYAEPLVRGVDCIDSVIYLDADVDLASILRRERIDAVFFPRPRLQEAWAALRSGVRLRIGSAYRWYSLLYNRRIREHRAEAAYHEAEYNVRMIMHAFACPMPEVKLVSPTASTKRSRTAERPRIIIHPGSGGSARDWPADQFGALAQRLRQTLNAEILVTGIPTERALCDIVLRECPDAVDLCGRFDLAGMIELIAGADMLVANSTGVLHIAASLSVPVLGLYPSTPSMSRHRWGPYTEKSIVLESGPGDDMSAISVESAVTAAKELLRRT